MASSTTLSGPGKSILLKLVAWPHIPLPKSIDVLPVEQKVAGKKEAMKCLYTPGFPVRQRPLQQPPQEQQGKCLRGRVTPLSPRCCDIGFVD